MTTKNQISGYCYDAAGNLIIQGACGPALVYQYDAENRMTSTAGVSYTYDGDGKRVQKSNGRLHWYGTSSDALVETDLAGNNPTEFVFFNGKRIARRDAAGAISYFFSDHLGSSRVVTNAAGTIVEDSDYYPFGGERVVVDLLPNQNHKFTGKERDAESGLDFFIARYYSSQYGRFFSPDEFTGGPVDVFSPNDPLPTSPLPYADITNPQSLNKYTYTYNSPLRYTDPNGHCPTCLDKIQKFLDVAGFAPGPVGMAADAANATISLARGNFKEAGINALAVVPAVGDALKGSLKVGEAAVAASRGNDLIQANRKTGEAFEAVVKEVKQGEQTGVVSQITIKTDSGVKTRLDLVGNDPAGNVKLTEAKASATAQLTPNQTKALRVSRV